MASLLNITLEILEDEECIEIVNTIDPIIRTMTLETDQKIHFIADELLKSQAELQATIGRKRKSALTAEMKSDDDERGTETATIRAGIQFFIRKKQTVQREAALFLDSIYNDAFAGGVSENNTIQTNQINQFLSAMESEEAKQAAKIIGITSEVASLAESNRSYNEKRAERNSIRESDTTPLITPSRRNLHSDIAFLDDYLKFHHRKESAVHSDLAEKLSQAISTSMAVARARHTRKENSSN